MQDGPVSGDQPQGDRVLQLTLAGLQALAAGDAVQAAQLGEEAAGLAPERADGWLLLCAALTKLGSADTERAMADALAKIPHGDPARLILEADRARELAVRGRAGEAAEIALRLKQLPELPARQLDTLGSVFATIGLFEDAVAMCAGAARAMPQNPMALYNFATALRYVGRIDEAEAIFGATLARDPDHSLAHASLAHLRKWDLANNHVAALRAALSRASPGGEDAARLLYATFKELNDLGRDGEAWTALSEAARTIRRLWPYPLAEKRARVAALIENFSAERLRTPPRHDTPGHRPIFIYGLPRSGTTLTERILAAHSRVTAMGETPGFLQAMRAAVGQPRAREIDAAMIRHVAQSDFGTVARHYIANTAYLARGADLATEKLPHNYEYVGAMHLAFPDAPLIHVRRSPMDSLFGAFRLLFGEGAYLWSYGFEELAESYRQYRQLMAHWNAALGERIVEVTLEDLIEQPELQIRRVLEHCGLAFEPACLAPHVAPGGVSTASSSQVRAPINREGVGAWRRYARELEPLRVLLQRDGFVDAAGDDVRA